MTNSDLGDSLISEILRSVAKEYGWPDFESVERVLTKTDAAIFPAYVGTYENEEMGREVVTTKGGKLYVQMDFLGPNAQELFPESGSRFFMMFFDDITVSFLKEDDSPNFRIVLQAGDETFQVKKLR